MKFAVDLHIHSALSPCADKDMTPNNIVNMAVLKGLDAIAVTDHNSAANLQAISICAQRNGLVFIPGMEVETTEEIHIVCLMPDLESMSRFSAAVRQAMPRIENRPDIFGRQLIMDENDNVVCEEPMMLLTACRMTADDVTALARELNGVAVPAHVDRPSYSIISNLGFVPEEFGIKFLEISRDCDAALFRSMHPELESYQLVRSSDAHYLGDILERESMLELDELSPEAIIRRLANGQG
ncbi:MAG TPA: PHP domain-containing protein [Clostridiales bacterium]|nr:PHP domain-containing protein [Clostridiales bacterium]HPV02240.1 PHP domain-containing protein [Clostridiales bacterium]